MKLTTQNVPKIVSARVPEDALLLVFATTVTNSPLFSPTFSPQNTVLLATTLAKLAVDQETATVSAVKTMKSLLTDIVNHATKHALLAKV